MSGTDHDEEPAAGPVADAVAELAGLSHTAYLRAVVDQLRSDAPDPVCVAAWRSPALAARTERALRSASGPADRTPGSLGYRRRLDLERRLLRTVVDGDRARRGSLPVSPNPRRRAEHRLAQLNLREDCPRGRILQLLDEEQPTRGAPGRA